jgi:hypothetical protein
MTVNELIEKIQSKSDDVRGDAWQAAGPVGAPAVKPLAGLIASGELEVARAAKRAIERIVHHAGRPGAEPERAGVAKELLSALGEDRPVAVKRELLWSVSEIAVASEASAPVAALLASAELRDDAKMVLERIPGDETLARLWVALDSAPAEFRPSVASSLRARGVEVPGYPSVKLVPAKETEAKPKAE